MTKRCLLIADGFPPAASSGVYRLAAMARLLPEHGWEVHVLAPGDGGDSDYAQWGLPPDYADHVTHVPWCAPQISPKLKAQVRQADRASLKKRLLSPVLRATKRLANLVFFPDAGGFSRWVGPASRRGLDLCRALEPHVIYASAPSYSVCTVAQRLHRQTGIPWVCELRDPFYRTEMLHAMPTAWHRRQAFRMEDSWLTECAAAVVTTDTYREQLTRDHPSAPAEALSVVYNGFEKLREGDDAKAVLRDGFRITYCGVIDPFRDPRPLFQAVRALADEDASFARAVRLEFVGTCKVDVLTIAAETGVRELVETRGQVPYGASVDAMRQADLLLNINYYVRGGTLEIPAKTFDYIAAGVPILMLSNPCECADIVTRSGMGVIVPPTDVAQIKTALKRLWECKRDGRPTGLAIDREYVLQFHRPAQVKQIAEILDSVVAR